MSGGYLRSAREFTDGPSFPPPELAQADTEISRRISVSGHVMINPAPCHKPDGTKHSRAREVITRPDPIHKKLNTQFGRCRDAPLGSKEGHCYLATCWEFVVRVGCS